jgi:histidinol-phosphate aminotransferase
MLSDEMPEGLDGLEALRHHGDREGVEGLLDFAVNVRASKPPAWLRQRLARGLDRLGHYPAARLDERARAAVAARHGRQADEVCVLAGAAEGFALLPNLAPRLAAVVHPSFTEPEVALRAAGVPVHRVLCNGRSGFQMASDLVPDEADLVVLGNPTNPTSVMHAASTIAALCRPGRTVVVDEAFADAVPGEPESLASRREPGLLVLRSLTKTWSLAGLRAGYALGSRDLLAALTRRRAHWPVSSLALEATEACMSPGAVAEAEAGALAIGARRGELVDELAGIPAVAVTTPAAGPFVLLRVRGSAGLRRALAERGIAVRRGDTFPGLSGEYVRVAVREAEHNALLVQAMRGILGTCR